MDFPTLISYTSPFLNQGLHGGIYIFFLKKLSYRHAITIVYVWSIPVVTLDTVAKIDYTSVIGGKLVKK